MEILALVLIAGALWAGYKVGCDAATTQLLESQSQTIRSAISTDNEFFQKTGLHGSYLLEGHEYRSPTDYVIVKYSDLEKLLLRMKQGTSDGDES